MYQIHWDSSQPAAVHLFGAVHAVPVESGENGNFSLETAGCVEGHLLMCVVLLLPLIGRLHEIEDSADMLCSMF